MTLSDLRQPVGLACGILLIGFASVQIFASGNKNLEEVLCRFWVCSTNVIAEDAYQTFLEGDSEQQDAIPKQLELAVTLDPASSYRWADLAESLLASGNPDKASYCMRRAIELGPHSGAIQLRAANFDFRTGQTREALGYLSQILRETAEYDSIVFNLFDRLGGTTADVLRWGVPPERRPAQSYFRHLLANGEFDAIGENWPWIQAHQFVDQPLAVAYVNYLVKSRHFDQAQNTWAGFTRAQDLLFNGDFQTDPTGAVLDWNFRSSESVKVTREPGNLTLEFNGKENVAFESITHQVILRPGTYVFRATEGSEGITTDQGVAFQILDAEAPERLNIMTQPLTGTVASKIEEKRFSVSPSTRLVEVRLVRRASAKFDSKIAGRAWFRKVSISPVT